MKQWDKMIELWNEYEVPSIQIKDFIIGENTIDSPWYAIKSGTQKYFPENPIKDTAYHLAVSLKDKDIELVIAYKILAYLRSNRLKDVLNGPLSYAMNKYDEKLYDWWNLNATNILPYCSVNLDIDHKPTDKDWAIIVTQAANTWKGIANEWGIIIIPSFMNQDSEEYKAFEDFSEKIHKERRYQEYLRLKKEFENE